VLQRSMPRNGRRREMGRRRCEACACGRRGSSGAAAAAVEGLLHSVTLPLARDPEAQPAHLRHGETAYVDDSVDTF